MNQELITRWAELAPSEAARYNGHPMWIAAAINRRGLECLFAESSLSGRPLCMLFKDNDAASGWYSGGDKAEAALSTYLNYLLGLAKPTPRRSFMRDLFQRNFVSIT